jgi:hypothetical protein
MKRLIVAIASLAFAGACFGEGIGSVSEMGGQWGKDVQVERSADSVKVSSPGGENVPAAIASSDFQVNSAGTEWALSFQAKGTVPVMAMVSNKTDATAKKGERLDILKQTELQADEWSKVEATFKMPNGVVKSALNIFCWEKKGQFEIKDLSLKPVAQQ